MSPKNYIVGTAGHIDHGKTTLIKALSGTDTDRLSEEKKRGISIDLGFTDLDLNEEYTVGIVDVPGHEKFIKNMLAGAGGVDIALLVIAADEGVMPQTREHLDILSLLNVQKGIIVLTKIDMVENEWVELMIEEIKEELADTFLNNSPLVPVSATENIGIEDLKNKIIGIIDELEEKDVTGNVYFPIDRVFTIKGYGTIVTGTLVSGKIDVEDKLTIYPEKKEVRVRSLEVHNSDADSAYPGQRVGINLSGVDKNEINRGDVLATPESLINTEFLDARLKVLKNAPLIVEHGDRIRFHIGANEIIGRVYLLDKKEVLPGESGLVQFRLEEKTVARFNENYVIRRYSPMTTIGGGNILETHPHRKKRFNGKNIEVLKRLESINTIDRVEYLTELQYKTTVSIEYLVKKSSLKKENIKNILDKLKEDKKVIFLNQGSIKTLIHKSNFNKLKDEVIENLNKFHENNKLKIGISKEELRTRLTIDLDNLEFNNFLELLGDQKLIKIVNSYIKKYNRQIVLNEKEKLIRDEILTKLKDSKFMPPSLEEITDNDDKRKEVFNYLVDQDDIIHLKEDLFFLTSAVNEAKKLLINYLEDNNSITLGEYRDLLDSSRKYTLALLEYFDQKQITKRTGEKRILFK
ncbi:MAG: selenocysteine-specific translation elongation factor [Bacillota bacterium]